MNSAFAVSAPFPAAIPARRLAPRLRAGSYIIADNADACADYKAAVRGPGSGYVSLPFGEDVELTLKL